VHRPCDVVQQQEVSSTIVTLGGLGQTERRLTTVETSVKSILEKTDRLWSL
jgi:hypothetical protein